MFEGCSEETDFAAMLGKRFSAARFFRERGFPFQWEQRVLRYSHVGHTHMRRMRWLGLNLISVGEVAVALLVV